MIGGSGGGGRVAGCCVVMVMVMVQSCWEEERGSRCAYLRWDSVAGWMWLLVTGTEGDSGWLIVARVVEVVWLVVARLCLHGVYVSGRFLP